MGRSPTHEAVYLDLPVFITTMYSTCRPNFWLPCSPISAHVHTFLSFKRLIKRKLFTTKTSSTVHKRIFKFFSISFTKQAWSSALTISYLGYLREINYCVVEKKLFCFFSCTCLSWIQGCWGWQRDWRAFWSFQESWIIDGCSQHRAWGRRRIAVSYVRIHWWWVWRFLLKRKHLDSDQKKVARDAIASLAWSFLCCGQTGWCRQCAGVGGVVSTLWRLGRN